MISNYFEVHILLVTLWFWNAEKAWWCQWSSKCIFFWRHYEMNFPIWIWYRLPQRECGWSRKVLCIEDIPYAERNDVIQRSEVLCREAMTYVERNKLIRKENGLCRKRQAYAKGSNLIWRFLTLCGNIM